MLMPSSPVPNGQMGRKHVNSVLNNAVKAFFLLQVVTI